MKLFSVPTALYRCRDLAELASEFSVGAGDVILTNRHILPPSVQPSMGGACVLFREDFGRGEPTDAMVDAIRAACPPDAGRVIAMGGGSILDIGKLLALPPDMPLADCLTPGARLTRVRELLLVPATCGTGSEVTNISVLTFPSLHFKGGIAADALYADAAVLIPSLLESLPLAPFAAGLMDALIHAAESYISPKATALSRMFSVRAMELILGGLRRLAQWGSDRRMELAEDFLTAATLAGIAFGNAGCGAVHAMSYPLGEKYHVPHGLSNYCLFLAVLRGYQSIGSEALESLKRVLAANLDCPPEDALSALERLLESFYPRSGMAALGACPADIPVFVDAVQRRQGRLMANACVPLTPAQLAEIYNRSM